MTGEPRVVGMGAAILDSIAQVTYEMIEPYGLHLGGMTIKQASEIQSMAREIDFGLRIPGGSVSNSMCMLARLGTPAGQVARWVDDEAGKIYADKLSSWGVSLIPPLAESSGANTSQAMIFVTPDAERSMAVNIDASARVTADDFPSTWSETTEMVVLEGYMWCDPTTMREAVKLARIVAGKKQIAMTCPDYFSCNNMRAELRQTAAAADILFANEEEYTALCDADNLESALEQPQVSSLTVVTKGAEGVTVLCDGNRQDYASEAALNPVDSTGAGDAFAAGFLHRHLGGEPISSCVELGSRLGRMTVGVNGAHLSGDFGAV